MSWRVLIPELGEEYQFKDKYGRGEYTATPIDLLSLEDAKDIIIKVPTIDFDRNNSFTEMSLLEKWEESKLFSPDIYNEITDFIIKTSIPAYSHDPIFLVRGVDHEWVSLETTELYTVGELKNNERN
jgi:hypothetical protein